MNTLFRDRTEASDDGTCVALAPPARVDAPPEQDPGPPMALVIGVLAVLALVMTGRALAPVMEVIKAALAAAGAALLMLLICVLAITLVIM